jgi:hypothetical protein
MQGGAMTIDVENLRGSPTAANALRCGPLACVVFGGAGNDTLWGGASADLIVGGGGSDVVATRGGKDVVDLVHAGAPTTQTIDCNGDNVTVLAQSTDTKQLTSCTNANLP